MNCWSAASSSCLDRLGNTHGVNSLLIPCAAAIPIRCGFALAAMLTLPTRIRGNFAPLGKPLDDSRCYEQA